MKKQTILDLIRYHVEGNEPGFRSTAYAVAEEFNTTGDRLLAETICRQLTGERGFLPQEAEPNVKADLSDAFRLLEPNGAPLPLPDIIMKDVMGIAKAINRHMPVNKFLFQGPPGTGKTETVKHLARLLSRRLYAINFAQIIDSKMGQTAKNLESIFRELKNLSCPEAYLFLIDEIDAIALDRTNEQDIREMGRVTSAFLKELDDMNPRVILVATTNLYGHFDSALSRRFDAVVDFSRYTQEDLLEIADQILTHWLSVFHRKGGKKTLFHRIIQLQGNLPYPGDLNNSIKSSLIFSDPDIENDYLRRLYMLMCDGKNFMMEDLRKKGFTVREIQLLTGISKSTVSRSTQGVENADD